MSKEVTRLFNKLSKKPSNEILVEVCRDSSMVRISLNGGYLVESSTDSFIGVCTFAGISYKYSNHYELCAILRDQINFKKWECFMIFDCGWKYA